MLTLAFGLTNHKPKPKHPYLEAGQDEQGLLGAAARLSHLKGFLELPNTPTPFKSQLDALISLTKVS